MLCQTAIVYRRTLDGKVLSFGHEGTLYRQSFVMYDKQTNSLWLHTTGEAVKGPMKGKRLPFVPSTVTSWKRWRALHPKTVVLTGARSNGFMGRFGLDDGIERYGLSVGQGDAPKLYPYKRLAAARVVNDTVAGTPVVVYYDAESRTAKAYERGARTFAWSKGRAVDDKGVAYDLFRGMSTSQPPVRLKQVVGTVWLVNRWRGFYPDGATWK